MLLIITLSLSYFTLFFDYYKYFPVKMTFQRRNLKFLAIFELSIFCLVIFSGKLWATKMAENSDVIA